MKNISIAIIIPMYNEEKNAARCVHEVIKKIRNYPNTSLIVINDGSLDKTGQIVNSLTKKYNKKLILVNNKKNSGYGGALSTGVKTAINRNFDYALFMDSDLTNNPRDIRRFVAELKYNPDCIKASRYIKGGGTLNIPRTRMIISMIGNIIASRLFNVGIKDCTNGFRMTKLSLIKSLKYKESGFSIILEELYYLKKGGAKFLEIPVVLTSRLDTKSSFNYNLKTFYNYLKYPIMSFLNI